jgi:hypothetical protein
MRVNLISLDNGVGLSRDITLMRELFEKLGHTARYADYRLPSRQADLNVYLEVIHERHLETAPRHIGVFNLEWFQSQWLGYLSRMTQLWAKSQAAFEWYREHGYDQVTYTGFCSRDMLDRSVLRQRRVLHVKGRSYYKGTGALLEAYKRWGAKLPELVVVTLEPVEVIPNVKQYIGTTPEAAFRQLMNECVIHCVPAEIEGWGHVIAEGLSCKAVMVTTDASPMFEHVQPSFGRLLTPSRTIDQGLVKRHVVEPDEIHLAIQEIMARPDEVLADMQLCARVRWAARQQQFFDTAKRLLGMI